jgi:hypothetical protein
MYIGITSLSCQYTWMSWEALHIGPSTFLVAMRVKEAIVLETWGWPVLSAGVAALGRLLWAFKKPIVQVVIISEQLLMISAGSFCNKWKYFCPLLGVGRAVANCVSAIWNH